MGEDVFVNEELRAMACGVKLCIETIATGILENIHDGVSEEMVRTFNNYAEMTKPTEMEVKLRAQKAGRKGAAARKRQGRILGGLQELQAEFSTLCVGIAELLKDYQEEKTCFAYAMGYKNIKEEMGEEKFKLLSDHGFMEEIEAFMSTRVRRDKLEDFLQNNGYGLESSMDALRQRLQKLEIALTQCWQELEVYMKFIPLAK
jgi:hypothetical protein